MGWGPGVKGSKGSIVEVWKIQDRSVHSSGGRGVKFFCAFVSGVHLGFVEWGKVSNVAFYRGRPL